MCLTDEPQNPNNKNNNRYIFDFSIENENTNDEIASGECVFGPFALRYHCIRGDGTITRIICEHLCFQPM
jgi:hypothetical protein